MQLWMKDWAALLVGLCVLWMPAKGQDRSVVRGTVEDASGDYVPRADIRPRNKATGKEVVTTSTEEGRFIFGDLPFGITCETFEAAPYV